jgi:hypothetical protein
MLPCSPTGRDLYSLNLVMCAMFAALGFCSLFLFCAFVFSEDVMVGLRAALGLRKKCGEWRESEKITEKSGRREPLRPSGLARASAWKRCRWSWWSPSCPTSTSSPCPATPPVPLLYTAMKKYISSNFLLTFYFAPTNTVELPSAYPKLAHLRQTKWLWKTSRDHTAPHNTK